MHSALNYQVFLTRNSEYHVKSHVCVGVRDRRTGQWFSEHPALSRALSSVVRTADSLAPLRTPHLGESLEFDLDGEPLRTSPVLNIERARGLDLSSAARTGSRVFSKTRSRERVRTREPHELLLETQPRQPLPERVDARAEPYDPRVTR
jgi:hypothetical protein